MNFLWFKHVFVALATTAFCCTAAFGLAEFLSLRLPSDFDQALTIKGIFFAALIGTLTYMPAIRPPEGSRTRTVMTTFAAVVVLSGTVAIACSIGGGVIRRWIAGDETVLSQPLSIWWDAMFGGWIVALSACLLNFNVYQRFRMARFVLDKIDAWIMGVFASAGALASLNWHPFGDYSKVTFIQLAQAAVFAALTGAAGGLVAKIFSRLTFAYRGILQLGRDLRDWAVADYTNIGIGVGVFSFVVFRSLTAILKTKPVTTEEFLSHSVDAQSFVYDLMHPATALDTKWIDMLIHTNQGLVLLLYVVFGFAACYMFRSST